MLDEGDRTDPQVRHINYETALVLDMLKSEGLTVREFVYLSLRRSHSMAWGAWMMFDNKEHRDQYWQWRMEWGSAINAAFPDEAKRHGFHVHPDPPAGSV